MADPLNPELQKLNQTSPLIDLHVLDCTGIGGSVYRFTSHKWENDAAVVFQGNTYLYLPIQLSGFETAAGTNSSSGGSLPQAEVSISNVSNILLASVVSLGDLVGATYYRMRTFAKFLDGQAGAQNWFLGPESFIVTQKTQHNKLLMKFKLRLKIDLPGAKLPANKAIRDSITGMARSDTLYDGFPGLSIYRLR